MHNKHAKIKRASLNHTFRLVWSETKQAFVAVAEISSGKGKRSSGVVGAAAAVMLGFAGPAHALDPGALPDGVHVTHGQASISQSGHEMNIHQTTDRLITNWQSFNIGEQATVNFHQPDANSAALNRIHDQNPSQILGNLNANGQVYLVNSSGIVFGQNAQVDVGGLIASTLDIADQDFIDGNLNFKNLGFSAGEIKNLGHIKANGGVVALIANRVSNQGTIEANNGNVALAAGDHVTLDFSGDGLMTVTVEQGVLDALAENGGLIRADGGFVIMTTQAQHDIYRNVVNNDGVIQAQTLASSDGKIMLMGGMSQGQVVAGGKLDASAPTTGDGGFVETSAAKVDIRPDLAVTTRATQGETGEWLIDPTDIEIVAGSGGDFTGDPVTSSTIGAETLISNLANNNVTIQTPDTGSDLGNITVNADIVWNANTQLTLDADSHIFVNAKIENTNTTGGGVYFDTMDPDSAVQFAENGKVVIYSLDQLQWVGTALQGNYELGADIDTGSIENWVSIGGMYRFSGHFDGLGHSIENLTVNQDVSAYNNTYGGLFSRTDGARIQNLNLINVDITANSQMAALARSAKGTYIDNVTVSGKLMAAHEVGALVANLEGLSVLTNSSSTADVTGGTNVGGLVGSLQNSTIRNSYSTGKVTGLSEDSFTGVTWMSGNASQVGGLVGYVIQGLDNDRNLIENSYATGDVTGTSGVGGLVGYAAAQHWLDSSVTNSLSITSSYATGNVSAVSGRPIEYGLGGLVGILQDGSVERSYATGSVVGNVRVGGLIGELSGSSVAQSYATGNVTGREVDGRDADTIGGLVGFARSESTVTDSYAISTVVSTSNDDPGGLIGVLSDSTVSNGYAVSKNDTGTPGASLIGKNVRSTVIAGYWDTTVSGQLDGEGGERKTSEEMQTLATYNDGSEGWDIVEDSTVEKGSPLLAWTLGRDDVVWVIGTKPPAPTEEGGTGGGDTGGDGGGSGGNTGGDDTVGGGTGTGGTGADDTVAKVADDQTRQYDQRNEQQSTSSDLQINGYSGTTLLASLGNNNLIFDHRQNASIPVNFSVVGNTTTLELDTASPQSEDVTLEGLPIFASTGGELALDSLVTVQDQGSRLSATRSGAQDSNVSSPDLATAVITEQTQTEVMFDNGQSGQMTVSMTEDGTLIIEIPQNAQTADENQVVLLGLAAAKRAGVRMARLKGIVVQRT